ncbi:MAG: peptidase E [Clostridia bacterium]|nr:peptidase E [Clostridia bacterium]
MGKYDEIINLPHHVSKYHKKMSNYDRAAQFSPFAALTGYDQTILETARETFEKIELSEENRDLNNRKLQIILENIKKKPLITIKYFKYDAYKEGGAYVEKSMQVKRIEPVEQKLVFTDNEEISFEQIYEMKSEIFENLD